MNIDFKYKRNNSHAADPTWALLENVCPYSRLPAGRQAGFPFKRFKAFGFFGGISKGFWNALDDISPDKAYVVAPVEESYPIKGGVMVSPLQEIIAMLQEE